MEYVWNNSFDPPGKCASTAVGEFLVARNGVKWISGHQNFNLTYFWSPEMFGGGGAYFTSKI